MTAERRLAHRAFDRLFARDADKQTGRARDKFSGGTARDRLHRALDRMMDAAEQNPRPSGCAKHPVDMPGCPECAKNAARDGVPKNARDGRWDDYVIAPANSSMSALANLKGYSTRAEALAAAQSAGGGRASKAEPGRMVVFNRGELKYGFGNLARDAALARKKKLG